MMKNPQVFGAGFKPALRRLSFPDGMFVLVTVRLLGGFETRYKTVLRRYVCDVFHAKIATSAK